MSEWIELLTEANETIIINKKNLHMIHKDKYNCYAYIITPNNDIKRYRIKDSSLSLIERLES